MVTLVAYKTVVLSNCRVDATPSEPRLFPHMKLLAVDNTTFCPFNGGLENAKQHSDSMDYQLL